MFTRFKESLHTYPQYCSTLLTCIDLASYFHVPPITLEIYKKIIDN